MKLIDQCPEYHLKNDILNRLPIIGKVNVFSLLTSMSELGNIYSGQSGFLWVDSCFLKELHDLLYARFSD
ncbi:MAG: hypothetical protein KAH20_14965 [Methylococcales bacterium]|nr:hypothetical protein [Methylococcales bacterium]